MSELGCPTVAGDVLLGRSVAYDLAGTGVPVTVGDVAVSLKGRGAAG